MNRLLGALLLTSLFSNVQAEQLTLGVEDAIDHAVQSNLRTRLAQEKIKEIEAEVEAGYAALRPRFNLNVAQYNRSVNLASQGLSGAELPIPNRIGPFYSFGSTLEMLYRVYDRARHWDIKSREIRRTLSELQSEEERRALTVLTSAAYIQLLEAEERERVSRTDLELAEKLVQQALDQEAAGIAAGVDVTRAQTRQAERELQLQQDRQQIDSARRRLLRLTGLPLTSDLALQDGLLNLPNPFPSVEQTVALALEGRLEVKIADEQVALVETQLQKARSSDSPALDLVADAGLSGNTPTQSSTFVHSVGLRLTIPMFDGGEAEALSKVKESQVEQARMDRVDVAIQIELEVRDAYSLLTTAQASLVTAGQSIRLAEQELEMSQDRFQAGLTDSLEVLAAEAALARARYSRQDALANYDLGLIRLASASGRPDLLLDAFRTANLRKGLPDEQPDYRI